MTKQERNAIFEENQYIINITVHRHWSLLKTLRMEPDDLKQELSICLLRAIEKYDPSRGAKPSTFYFTSLKYGVLNLWREQVRKCRLANLTAAPLIYTNEDGEVFDLELPFEVDYDMNMRINELLRVLSPQEQRALARTVRGDDPEDKRHKRFMSIVRRKALRYNIAAGGAL